MGDLAEFAGFGVDAMSFLDGLAVDNSKTYFDDRRQVYDQQIAGPLKSLVVAVGDQLRDRVSSEIDFEPKIGKSMFRINRDLRFAKDKTPYNTHLDAVWWQGESSRTSPGFIMRITPSEAIVGTGIFGMQGEQLDRFRSAMLDDALGTEFEELLASTKRALKGAAVSEPQRKRVPKGFPTDHVRSEMLKYERLHVSASQPSPASITTAKFATWVADRHVRIAPLQQWFVANVSG